MWYHIASQILLLQIIIHLCMPAKDRPTYQLIIFKHGTFVFFWLTVKDHHFQSNSRSNQTFELQSKLTFSMSHVHSVSRGLTQRTETSISAKSANARSTHPSGPWTAPEIQATISSTLPAFYHQAGIKVSFQFLDPGNIGNQLQFPPPGSSTFQDSFTLSNILTLGPI